MNKAQTRPNVQRSYLQIHTFCDFLFPLSQRCDNTSYVYRIIKTANQDKWKSKLSKNMKWSSADKPVYAGSDEEFSAVYLVELIHS